MGGKKKVIHKKHRSRCRHVMAAMLFLCLLLSQLNVRYILTYAEESKPVIIQAGKNVTAALENGVLTLSGAGKTNDYTKEETPFLEYSQDIRQVVIEDGITYIGSFLFYGLGNLQGKLTLPKSITGFGDSVFSGNSKKTSAAFTEIINNAKADQKIENVNTLFYKGQTGAFHCEEENRSFNEAATYAGYKSEVQEKIMEDTPEKEQSADTVNKKSIQSSSSRSVKSTSAKQTETVVYVDQDHGDDTLGDGSEDQPYKTLDQAADGLATEENGGTVSDNKIVLLSDYYLDASDNTVNRYLFLNNPRPVTITGKNKDIKCGWKDDDIKNSAGNLDNENAFINLQSSIRFKSVSMWNVTHIYGNGNNITVDEEVTNNREFYLYGAGRSGIVDNKVGEIKAYSGKIARIIGYVRSYADLDARNLEAKITVGGTASVTSIIGGSASGKIKNGKVSINIEGGTIKSQVVGGNQGYLKGEASFIGSASIHITGGTVSNLYGAGLGRNQSIPTFLGKIDINVSGGTVSNLYGAGSAAYVVSDSSNTSSVDISVTNGTVGNIYAAGEGGDSTVKNEGSSTIDHPEKMGSLTGSASIDIGGSAKITGSIYGSGKGYHTDTTNYDTSQNAYLEGTSKISISGGTIEGSVYGGGGGIEAAGYEESARVDGSTSVTFSGGTIKMNLFGGGKQGKVYGNTELNVRGGTVNGSVYGGALGKKDKTLVSGQTTVNMTNGWVRGNLYGGSELSNNGPEGAKDDLIFVNLSGGEVSGSVFGGGYQGKVNGSTHLHIGILALDECNYYMSHEDQKPELSVSKVLISGSVYAGGDYGGDTVNYDEITVSGTSHVYIDGKGYKTGTEGSEPEMTVSGGVFGSGASCDAGSTRIVTILNYGEAIKEDGKIKGATRSISAIQRADRVVLRNSHIELKGQSDVANANQTELYSLNRIGDHGSIDGLGTLGHGLILQSGSTMILDSAVIEIACFKSLDENGRQVALEKVQDVPNTVMFSEGTVFRVSYTNTDGNEIHGAINGYAYMAAENTAVGYAYARTKTESINPDDGGFTDPSDSSKELEYKNIGSDYRYWRVAGADATSTRSTVLTAQTLESGNDGYGGDGYSVVHEKIELPPAESGTSYTVRSISLPSGVTLVESAKDGLQGGWAVSGTGINTEDEKARMDQNPLTAFGLYMKFSSGFNQESSESIGNVISNKSAVDNSIIGKEVSYSGSDGKPNLEFYLTFNNDGITASQDLGTVKVELTRKENGSEKEITTINVQIVTKATALSDQTVDVYATQGGSYDGTLLIPAGTTRKLSLTGVTASAQDSFVKATDSISGNQFSLTMKPVSGQGWSSSGLMTEAYDLAAYTSGSISIGTTDNRYQGPITFHLKNASGFTAKNNPDTVQLKFYDESEGGYITITLNIHWKKSVVSSINRQAGKAYDDVGNPDSVQVSSNSALTAAFQLDIENTEETQKLWLELQTGKGSKAALPAGTKLTMLYSDAFYSYQVTGTEENNRVYLTGFKKMWDSGGLSNVSSGLLTVITNFDSAEGMLATGDYSLRLRSDTGADSIGAGFTVDNSEVSLETTGTGGLSKGQQTFTLKINRNSDTRFTETAAAVISQEEIPKGTIFTCQGKTYYPNGGSVYIPLAVGEKISVIMNTENTAGLTPGEHTLSVRIFPVGVHAGGVGSSCITRQLTYEVKDNPFYGLTAKLTDGSRRTDPGETLKFEMEYITKNRDELDKIEVKVQKKSGTDYENITGWTISGNDNIKGEGSQNISVTAPQDTAAGTYRLNFTLGNRTVPYNIVVAK